MCVRASVRQCVKEDLMVETEGVGRTLWMPSLEGKPREQKQMPHAHTEEAERSLDLAVWIR